METFVTDVAFKWFFIQMGLAVRYQSGYAVKILAAGLKLIIIILS